MQCDRGPYLHIYERLCHLFDYRSIAYGNRIVYVHLFAHIARMNRELHNIDVFDINKEFVADSRAILSFFCFSFGKTKNIGYICTTKTDTSDFWR